MKTIDAIPIAELAVFDRLQKIADLIRFDGPLLSAYRAGNEDYYLSLWCDNDSDLNRWLLFSVHEKELKRYLHKETTLRNLVLNPRERV